MFTVDQINAAHAKVKTGADFPAYIQEIIQLGVVSFETFVSDSHTIYFGKDNFQTCSTGMYETMAIADSTNKEQFIHCLKIHQQGQTDYPAFCRDCAAAGIEKWIVDLQAMTCTYIDKENNEVLVETIPG
jgi:uncharacterized protein YbcV (DUF1398 family)